MSVLEITRVQNGGRPPAQKPFSGSVAVGGETSFVDVYNEKPIRLATKVLVPTHQNPKVNYKLYSLCGERILTEASSPRVFTEEMILENLRS